MNQTGRRVHLNLVMLMASLALAACGPNAGGAGMVTASPSAETATLVAAGGSEATATSPAAIPAGTGGIRGRIRYPSSFIPAVTVYALGPNGEGAVFAVTTVDGQSEYEISGLPAGSYRGFAYLKSEGAAGGYTEYVRCGLAVECQDHSLIDVEVSAGALTEGVDVLDWYAPPETFPERPVLPGSWRKI